MRRDFDFLKEEGNGTSEHDHRRRTTTIKDPIEYPTLERSESGKTTFVNYTKNKRMNLELMLVMTKFSFHETSVRLE